MSDSDAVEVVGQVSQVRTLADGGLRVVLDLPEDAIPVAAWLMVAKLDQRAVKVRFEYE